MIRISCQEQLLPGRTLPEKWEFAHRAGYDGIELRARGDFAFRDRLPELRRAVRDGVPAGDAHAEQHRCHPERAPPHAVDDNQCPARR